MNNDMGLALMLLRAVRGWKQSDLARAAGVRYNSISVYERGAQAPDPQTLRQLVDAMGYPTDSVERARQFIAGLRGEASSTRGEGADGETAPGVLRQEAGGASETDRAAALATEVDEFAAAMEVVTSRLSRVLRELSRER
jgi:transcriptional regulator with XRE-family HTH domain